MPGQIVHIEIPADDTAKAREFYGPLFGWEFNEFPGTPGEYHVFQASDRQGGAITSMEPGKVGMRSYFLVDDINAGAARVKELGGEAHDPARAEHGLVRGLQGPARERLRALADGRVSAGRHAVVRRRRLRRGAADVSVALRPVEVDDKRTVADERDHELLGLVQRVHIPMDEADGHVEEPALFHLRGLPAARPEFEAEMTPDDVTEHLAIAVVVPARGDAAVDTAADVQRPLGRERDLAHDSGRRVSSRQAVGCDG
jgi:uncharacterized protein